MFQNTLCSVLVIFGALTIGETISTMRKLDDNCYERERDEERKHTCMFIKTKSDNYSHIHNNKY